MNRKLGLEISHSIIFCIEIRVSEKGHNSILVFDLFTSHYKYLLSLLDLYLGIGKYRKQKTFKEMVITLYYAYGNSTAKEILLEIYIFGRLTFGHYYKILGLYEPCPRIEKMFSTFKAKLAPFGWWYLYPGDGTNQIY